MFGAWGGSLGASVRANVRVCLAGMVWYAVGVQFSSVPVARRGYRTPTLLEDCAFESARAGLRS